MRTQSRWLLCFLVICGLALFAGISTAHGNETAVSAATTTATPTSTEHPDRSDPFLPLMCPKDIPLNEGLTWRGITVGKSRLQELEEIYGVIATRIIHDRADNLADTYTITLTSDAALERHLAATVEACVVDGKIAALTVDTVDDSETSDLVETWVARFGAPEIVAWSAGNSWRYRDLVWPKIGLTLHVDLGDASLKLAYITHIVFFPAVQTGTDLAAWPYPQLQRDPPAAPNEGFPTERNPFDFLSVIATATKQSITSMPKIGD